MIPPGWFGSTWLETIENFSPLKTSTKLMLVKFRKGKLKPRPLKKSFSTGMLAPPRM